MAPSFVFTWLRAPEMCVSNVANAAAAITATTTRMIAYSAIVWPSSRFQRAESRMVILLMKSFMKPSLESSPEQPGDFSHLQRYARVLQDFSIPRSSDCFRKFTRSRDRVQFRDALADQFLLRMNGRALFAT